MPLTIDGFNPRQNYVDMAPYSNLVIPVKTGISSHGVSDRKCAKDLVKHPLQARLG